MRSSTKSLIAAVAVTCMAMYGQHGAMGQSQLPPLSDIVRTQSQNQQQIRTDTQRVADDLSNIISEFERNGLGDEADVQVLKAIRSVLGNLSDKEMAQVVALLESARSAPDRGKAANEVADAVQKQKTIIIQLQQVVLEYQRQQELTDLSLRFARLATDQNRNMKAARELAKSTKGKSYTDEQSAILRVQKAEQSSIRDQVAALLTKLETLSKSVDQASAEKIARVLEDAGNSKLTDMLSQSVTDLDTGKLFSAVARERSARDKCRDLSRMMAVAPDAATVLREAINTLNGEIEEQKEIVAGAQVAGNDAARAEDLSDKQADLVDTSDILKKDIANVAPEAAEDLNSAMNKMQEARAAYGPDIKGASANATEALHKLEVARTRLAEQLAALQAQQAEKDTLAQIKKLEERIAELRAAEEKLKRETGGQTDAKVLVDLGTRQAELLKTTREIVVLAPSELPAVGQVLADAAGNMDQAQVALGTNADADAAGKPQQLAIDNLLKAEKLLQAQTEQQAKDEEKLKALEEARDKVAKAIEKEQKVQAAATDLAARKDQLDQPKKADAAADIAKKQDDVAKDTEQLQKDMQKAQDAAKADQPDAAKPDAKDQAKADQQDQAKADAAQPKDQNQAKADEKAQQKDQNAAKPDQQDQQNPANANQNDPAKDVQAAAQDMKDAKKSLDKQDPQAAANDAGKALDDLNKAKDGLDKQIADLQKQLGQNSDPNAKLDDLSKAIAQAQKELGDAQQQMGNQDQSQQKADDAAKKLGDVASDVTKAQAEDQGALPQQADKAMDQARDALTKAMAAEAGKDAKEAQDQAQKAQDALAQASAAVSMAKSGIRQSANSQKQQPGKPGPKGKDGQKADERNAKAGEATRKDDAVNADSRAAGAGPDKASSAFMALPARERQAILQDRNEKYPEEYGTMIEKYTKNLADSSR